MADKQAVQAAQTADAATETAEESTFAKLLQREFRPQSEQVAQRIESAVQVLAEQALADTTLISDDAIKSIQAMIAVIDKKRSEEHTSELQSRENLVCRLLLEKKKGHIRLE